MREIYSDYFLEVLKKESDLEITQNDSNKKLREIALERKIDKAIEMLQK